MDQRISDLAGPEWPGFRLLLAVDDLHRLAQPPNSQARHRFAAVHWLRNAQGDDLGVLIVTGHPQVEGQVVCIVRWNPDVSDEGAARAAVVRLLAA
jgi:hypothetical protein